ncbi:MAG: DUF1028 domain-containing protein [Acidimicrobiales bacterium]
MTCSIVARDAETGALGVAVQTCMFAVGAAVPWARPGVGAFASQAFGDAAYGPRCLDAMAEGATAAEALERARALDEAPFLRQVGVVSADGTASAFTGDWCIDHQGEIVGDGFTVQANMMASATVWPAMAEAYLAATGSFPSRLLAALDAGQAEGGDARGVMSAAMLVVAGDPGEEWAGRLVDLRIDRSDDPLGELATLLGASESYGRFGRAVDLLFAGDPSAALDEIDLALEELPGEENHRFLQAGAHLAAGDVDVGLAELRAMIAARPSLAVIARSYATKGLLAFPEGVTVEALLDSGPVDAS